MNSEIDRSITDMAADCLMLLSRVGQNGTRKRVFACRTCKKEFSSFQALGGHRASHKKLPAMEPHEPDSPKKAKTTSHECPICGLEFPMGQALGGHMRRHRNSGSGSGYGDVEAKTRWLLPAPVSMKKSALSGGKRVVLPVDLNLSLKPLENLDLRLGLGLGGVVF